MSASRRIPPPPAPHAPCGPGRRPAARPPRRRPARRSVPARPSGRPAAPRRARAVGSGAAGSPPCAAIIASHTGYAAPDASTVGRIGVDAGQRQHLLGQSHREFHDVRRAAAAQHLDRLGDLQRVADGPAQRDGHVGEHLGALGSVVSGSGPTCAFLSRSREAAVRLAAALAGAGVCRTVRVAYGPVPGARVVADEEGSREPTGE